MNQTYPLATPAAYRGRGLPDSDRICPSLPVGLRPCRGPIVAHRLGRAGSRKCGGTWLRTSTDATANPLRGPERWTRPACDVGRREGIACSNAGRPETELWGGET